MPVRKVYSSRSRDIITAYKKSDKPDPWQVPREHYWSRTEILTRRQIYTSLWAFVKYNNLNILVTQRDNEVYLSVPGSGE
jgi:hypothetical protein